MRTKNGTFRTQPEGGVMSMSAVETAASLIRSFEREDSLRCGGQQPARRALARKLGVAPGTLKSAREGRLKRICVEFFTRLKAEEMRRLNTALAGSEHDLAMARAIGLDPRSADFMALEAAVAAAQTIRAGAP